MAAIYSGIHLKLKSTQTPWEDKIKLARFAWISPQCLLPNKEQVLLDWCTHALTGYYNKKVEFSQTVLEGLWCYLDELLHSKKLHSFLKQGKSVSLRLNMAQLLLERLQDYEQSQSVAAVGLSTLLNVYQGILSTPTLSSVFTTKFELMVSLLSRFYRLMAEMLLKQAQPSIPAWYRCLKTLLGLNHLILEPDLEQLLSLAWINMDCTDTRVSRAKQVLLGSLLQTYTKLRQLPKFFSDLVSVIIEQTAENNESQDLDTLFSTILNSSQSLLTARWLSLSDLCVLEPDVQKLLCHLVEKCSSERFSLLLMQIKEGLDTGNIEGGNYREVLSTVILIKMMFCCPLPEPCFNALWLIAPQIISKMMFLVRSSSLDASLNLPFTVPVVAAVTTLLRQGEGVIVNPHHVTMFLGALQCVPLDRLAPAVYEETFTAIHEALFAIIKCHPQVMLKAAPSFLNVFYRLVSSIMQEGKQRKECYTDNGVSLRCSRLVQRMYSHIAAASEEFTTLSSFIVAQYVTELQKVTLQPDVKLHLTEGIYMILDLCLEQDIKFLMAGLHTGVREVFNELHTEARCSRTERRFARTAPQPEPL
uniref:Nucleolar 27S pre-rRNA processing Urb2/Npa2 C-terminal domain-containing protein n=1 Tax=Knipowitschia caucasica TaxID=637954 RepID=A0AAV2LUE7_KNICA